MLNNKQCLSRRGFLGGVAAFGALAGGGTRLFAADAEKPLLRFGVVSDVHVRLAPGGGSLHPDYDTETLEKAFTFFRDNGADAVMIAGDMADCGVVGELKAVADAWFRAFPNDRAPDGRKVERLFVFGNHDAYPGSRGNKVFADASELERNAILTDPKRAWDICFHEEWKPYYTKNVNGFDFFCSHWQPSADPARRCHGFAEKGSDGCADAFGALMAKSDPSRPFFYVQHSHPRDTVYGGGAWGSDDGTATRLLSRFPQAVSFSGHSHSSLMNDTAIWRGAFTSVATGSLRYLYGASEWNMIHTEGYENDVCNIYMPSLIPGGREMLRALHDAPKMMPPELTRPDIRVGQLVSVYDDRIVFAKREFVSGLPLGEDWVVERPAKPCSFAARAKMVKPAEFPAGAVLTLARVTAKTRGSGSGKTKVLAQEKPAVTFAFPAATVGGKVTRYRLSGENAGGTTRAKYICAVGGLYPRTHANYAKDVTATIPLDAFPEGATRFCVTPIDAFGNAGRALVATKLEKS